AEITHSGVLAFIGRVFRPFEKEKIESHISLQKKGEQLPDGEAPRAGGLSGAKLTGLWYSVEQPFTGVARHTAGADHCPLVLA
ncbi:hypothetical protein, partial [Escherichia coli]|uniref:hypothetical protein n=1 Tax=Escherichia coli TaxID=562 RepID=UPI003CED35C9